MATTTIKGPGPTQICVLDVDLGDGYTEVRTYLGVREFAKAVIAGIGQRPDETTGISAPVGARLLTDGNSPACDLTRLCGAAYEVFNDPILAEVGDTYSHASSAKMGEIRKAHVESLVAIITDALFKRTAGQAR